MISPGLVLLATECAVARHYLNTMLKLGILPERVIYLDLVPAGRNVLMKTYRKGRKLASILIRGKRNSGLPGKPPVIVDHSADIELSVKQWIQSSGFYEMDFSGTTKEMLDDAGLEYDSLRVESINSSRLIHFIKREVAQKYALFVSGGILRKEILSAGVKFIHIHPGFVPSVRGSDCMLWSALLYNNIGMSCFFMNEGIDAGDILLRHEYSMPHLLVPDEVKAALDSDYIYRIIVELLDPLYRADMLRKLLEKEPDMSMWNAQKQNNYEGKFYYHPHKIIRDKAIRLFFK